MYYVAIILVLLWTNMVYGGPMAFVCSPEPCEVVVDDPAVDARFMAIESRLDLLEGGIPPGLVWEPIISGDPLEVPPVLPVARGTLPLSALVITQGALETIQDLAIRVRTEKLTVSGPGPIYIVLRAGKQYLDAKISLTALDAGTSDNPIIYTSPVGEWSYLSGMRTVSGFVPVSDTGILDLLHPDIRDQIQQVDLSSWTNFNFGVAVPTNQTGYWPQSSSKNSLNLYFDSQRMTLARWPNTGSMTTIGLVDTTQPGRFEYSNDRAKRWERETDLFISGTFFWSYAQAYAPIDRIDIPSRSLVVRPTNPIYGPAYHQYGFKQGQPYFVLNALSELDVPGEWYFDRNTKILYFYPPSDLAGKSIELSQGSLTPSDDPYFPLSPIGELLIDVAGSSYITFEYLVIEGGRSRLVDVNGSDHISFRHSVVRHGSSLWGLLYRNGSSDSEITDSQLYDMTSKVVEFDAGNRAALTSGGMVLRNNTIHHFSLEKWGPGIVLKGVGALVQQNTISHSNDMAMQVTGNDHIIEFNRIHDVVKETRDAGVIYGGRDWSTRGNIVRYNHFIGNRDRDVMGVYLDDQLSGWTIFGNIFENTGRGILLGGGRDHMITNNIFTNNMWDLYIDGRGQGQSMVGSQQMTLLEAQPYQVPPWSLRYPETLNVLNEQPGLPLNNHVDHNIFLGSGINQEFTGAIGMINYLNNQDDTDPGYTLVIDSQYQLDASSLANFPAFQQLPFSQVGAQ